RRRDAGELRDPRHPRRARRRWDQLHWRPRQLDERVQNEVIGGPPPPAPRTALHRPGPRAARAVFPAPAFVGRRQTWYAPLVLASACAPARRRAAHARPDRAARALAT